MSSYRFACCLPALLVLAACSGGSGQPVVQVFVESEPNDGMAEANRVGTIDPEHLWEIRGEIQGIGGEWDVFEFGASQDTRVVFRLIPESEAEVVLLITDEDGAALLVLDEPEADGELRGEVTVVIGDVFMVVVYSLALDTAYRVRVTGSDPISLPLTEPPIGSAGGIWTSEADWPALRAAQLAERLGASAAAGIRAWVHAYTLEFESDWAGPTRIDVTVEVE